MLAYELRAEGYNLLAFALFILHSLIYKFVLYLSLIIVHNVLIRVYFTLFSNTA